MIRFCAHLVDDFRWAVRSLSQRPTQTVVTVLMLAVGIGANGAVFAVVNAALFKGFAFVHENERLVQISTSRNSIYAPDVLEWRAQARTFLTSPWFGACSIRSTISATRPKPCLQPK